MNILSSHLAILPPLDNSMWLVDLDLPDRREEPEIRVATTELFETVSQWGIADGDASVFSGLRRNRVT